jgi:hypothetical protein
MLAVSIVYPLQVVTCQTFRAALQQLYAFAVNFKRYGRPGCYTHRHRRFGAGVSHCSPTTFSTASTANKGDFAAILAARPSSLVQAEFIIARVPLTSYLCYLHVIHALPLDVVTAIRDITANITAESINAYDLVKQTLLQRFTCSELQRCFQLLVAPPPGDRNIAAHYSQLRSLIPTNGDVLFNAIFLRTLPAHISTALADRAELPSTELAAAQMQHTVTAQAAVAAATPLPPSPPPSVNAAPTQQ